MSKREQLAAFAGLQMILMDEFSTVDFLPVETFRRLQQVWTSEISDRDEFYKMVLTAAKELAVKIIKEDVQ